MTVRPPAFLLALVFLAASSDSSFGQTVWQAGTGDWFTAGNWTLGVPNSASGTAFDAIIANGGTAQLQAPGGSVRRLRVGLVGGPGSLLVNAGTLNVTDDLHLNEGSAGPASMTVQGGSTVTAIDTVVGFSSAFSTSFLISGPGTVYNATTSIIVGQSGAGLATLTVNNGAVLASGTSTMASNGFGNATVDGAGSRWSSTGAFTVGSVGTGTLNIQNQGVVHVGTALSINGTSTVNLNGGTLRFDTVSGLNRLNYTAGTIQLAGGRAIGFDSTISTLFGATPAIAANKALTIEGDTEVRTNLTVNGGTLTGQSGLFRVGFNTNGSMAVTGGGTVVSNVTSYIAVSTGVVASANVSGPGSSWTVNGALWVGVEGSGSMNITGGGTVATTGDGLIAYDTTGPFTTVGNVLVSGPGSTWTVGDDLGVGGPAGAGVLTIADQGLVYVTNGLFIDVNDTLNLNGGTIRFNTYIPSSGAAFNFNSGTIQLAGDRSLGTDAVIQQHFGSVPVIPAGKGLTVEGIATISSALTLNGGTLRASSLVVNGPLQFTGGLLELTGGTITGLTSLAVPTNGEFRASGVQSVRVTGAAGSTITATGNLTLGNATAVNGFGTQGTLQIGANTVTLLDSNDVVFDSLSLATLGSGGSPGTLSAANGLTLDFGGNLTGFGTVTTPNNVTKPLINNGHITGNSGSQRITLPGYVKGAGTFSPGLSPALTIVGSITLTPTNTLIMELGGMSRGGQYDAIDASGTLGLGGVMNVTLIDGFNPAAGHTFDLFDWATLSGTFATLNLPSLAAGLAWDMSQLYSTGVLSVASPGFQEADFDEDGDVDGDDLVRWRNNFGTGTTHMQGDADGDADADGVDFLTWQRQLGSPPSVVATAAVPEPTTLALTLFTLLVAGQSSAIKLDRRR